MGFIKRVLSTVTGIFVFFAILFVGLIVLGVAFSGTSKDTIRVKSNSILKLKLDFPIRDYAGKTVYKDYEFLNEDDKNGLFDIVRAIAYAKTDENIKGISIENTPAVAGITQLKTLREALLDFKTSGKFVTAYADVYSQKSYYLSTVADTLVVNPVGMLEFKGLSTEQLYFKDFQDKSGIKMEVVRHGKYKSAVEPFLNNEMSAENRDQISVYLNGLWQTLKTEIAQTRSIPEQQLDSIAEHLLGRTAKLALASRLVDKVSYYDEYIKGIKHAIDWDNDKALHTISIEKYTKHVAPKLRQSTNKNAIAVIYAEGDIIYGEGELGTVGHITLNKALRKARRSKKIKAVVLRINSPGGSALASELIWREIALTKKVKPVIVSMGDVAASGGYYIAANAHKIIAEPSTITGSIGVFGVLPNFKNLAERWGINAEQVVTNTNAITYSPFETLNDTQRQYIKEGIIDVYTLFTKRVQEGRGLTKDATEHIAQGRVWTGVDALKNGLVDELGGLDKALQYAAEAAEIEDYSTKELPIFKKELDEMLERFGLVKTKQQILEEEFGIENYNRLKNVKRLLQKQGSQLLFPYSVDIE